MPLIASGCYVAEELAGSMSHRQFAGVLTIHCGHCDTNLAARAMRSGVAMIAISFRYVTLGNLVALMCEMDSGKKDSHVDIYILRNDLRDGLCIP